MKDHAISRAVRDVLDERRRQVEDLGYDDAIDDEYIHGELRLAAACFAVQGIRDVWVKKRGKGMETVDAWPWEQRIHEKDKHSYRSRAVIACALLLADIERFDRRDRGEVRARDTLASLDDHDRAEVEAFMEFLRLPQSERRSPQDPKWRAFCGLPPLPKGKDAKP